MTLPVKMTGYLSEFRIKGGFISNLAHLYALPLHTPTHSSISHMA